VALQGFSVFRQFSHFETDKFVRRWRSICDMPTRSSQKRVKQEWSEAGHDTPHRRRLVCGPCRRDRLLQEGQARGHQATWGAHRRGWESGRRSEPAFMAGSLYLLLLLLSLLLSLLLLLLLLSLLLSLLLLLLLLLLLFLFLL
ncbi:unnamed protein product, partial [Polarella glacialis]